MNIPKINFIRNIRRSRLNREHSVCDGKKLYRNACRKIPEKPEAETNLDTHIWKRRSRAWMSEHREKLIEHYMELNTFTPDKMLIVHDPYGFAPLTALCVFRTKEECSVRVSLLDDSGWGYTSEPSEWHWIPIFGLLPDTKNRVLLEIFYEGKKIKEKEIILLTDRLPKYLKNMIKVEKKTERSALPWIFVYGGDTHYPYAFDEKGNIRYYLSEPPKAYGLFPLSGGRFLFLTHNISAPAFANPHAVLAYEMNLLGRTCREYYIEDGIHHDGCEISPGGNFLTVSSSMEKYVEDAIIEIDRESGKIVRKLCLADILSDHPYFDMFDWAHINTVSYLPEEHAVLLCARNIHSVVKINWDTFELQWILCDTEFWKGTVYESYVLTPMPDMEFSYQAHAAYMLNEKTAEGENKLIIFDNHWHARRPVESFDGDKSSYVRIYAIDENAHTVRLLQKYKCRKSKIRSNAIATDERIFSMSGFLNKPVDEYEGMINEYDRKSGKVLNRYLTYNSFYRAYPFFADYQALAKIPSPGKDRKLFGTEGALEPCQRPDIKQAKSMPLFRKRYYKKSSRKLVRKYIRGKQWREEQPEYKLKNDLREIYVRMYDRLLLLYNRDHVIEKVFFCGRQHNYVKDFSHTTQRSPHLFAESRYFLAIPTDALEPDYYQIYFQSRGVLFRLGKKIRVISKK